MKNMFKNTQWYMLIDQSETWQDVHRSDGNFDCETCLVFSPADICEHKVSDHNYYAICKVGEDDNNETIDKKIK